MAAQTAAPGGVTRPRFSIVTAVYNVARYLDEFTTSIDKQTFPLERIEVIAVDDGSTDNSREVLEAWSARHPGLVTILSQKNAGQAAARNAGLELATGEWVTFTDPDDVLDVNFFAEVDAFLTERPTTMLVATNRVTFEDATGEQSLHPLHKHFTKYNRLRNLDIDTRHFHGHAAGSFFRLDILRREKLQFDTRIRPNFEDGHFCCAYLLRVDAPMVGYLVTAIYNYRKRSDKSSTLDLSWSDPNRFITVPQLGFLALLREAVERRGSPPPWLQGMVLYELTWYVKTSDMMYALTSDDPEVFAIFHQTMTEIMALLDDDVIESYEATKLKPVQRDVLLHAYRDQKWHSSTVVVDKLDEHQNSLRAVYRFTGDLPDETFVVDGSVVEPFAAKIRAVKLFDRAVINERIVWLPAGTVHVELNGRDVETRIGEPPPPTRFLDSTLIKTRLGRSGAGAAPAKPAKNRGRYSKAGVMRRLARTAPMRRLFGHAWVLMDRIYNADDSAEHLFRWLRKNRPNVNAWFVIERGTPDYERLRRDGHRRVLPHGSFLWKMLMLNADHLISTHIDVPIVRPSAITDIVSPPRWRYTFLQHGVIKDDLSNWFNGKDIDVFVTSTPQEYESVAGDHTTYRVTKREVVLSGLPRFDRIREEGLKVPADRRHRILVTPTWRQWLVLHDATKNAEHKVSESAFVSSEYVREWTAFLSAPELREAAERTGSTISLLLHPNLQRALHLLKVPPYVELLQFEGENVQAMFASARVVITDYSSMAFNAAYIDRPLVYFQFDADQIFGGGHIGRRGYFEYERDGFGPVAYTADDAVAMVAKALEQGPDPEPLYRDRIAAAFPQRDGRCCERTADAIAASVKRVKPKHRASGDDELSDHVVTPLDREPAKINKLHVSDGPVPDSEPSGQ